MPVLGVTSHPAVGILVTTTRMIRRNDRLLHVIACATSAAIDSDLLMRGVLVSLRRLALGEATALDSTRTEVASIGQVLEAHVGGLLLHLAVLKIMGRGRLRDIAAALIHVLLRRSLIVI